NGTGAFSQTNNLSEEDLTPIEKPEPKRKWGCLNYLAAGLAVFVISVGVLFFSNRTLYQKMVDSTGAYVSGVYPQLTLPAGLVSTPTIEPTPTKTATIAPSLTPTIVPTQTLTPSPTITPTPTRTLSPTPTSTPVGGGVGQIAFASDRSGTPQIWLMNSDGSNLHQLTDIQRGACQPDWSPDGAQLIFTSPCEKNLEIYRDSSLVMIDADGSNQVNLFTSRGGDYYPAWSPDGKSIAFVSLRTNNLPQIYLMELETKEIERLSTGVNVDIYPSWSPGGSQILFISQRFGQHQIWTMDKDGGEQERLSISQDMINTYPVWSNDGKEILFTQSLAGGIPQLMAAYFPEGAVKEYRVYGQTELVPMRDAHYSPDASWLVLESWPDGDQHDIYIMQLNGDQLTQLTFDLGADFDPVWRPNTH
ncbi:MAG: hypothetical protein ABFS03_13925, partial [Chloroflexota bacterium]